MSPTRNAIEARELTRAAQLLATPFLLFLTSCTAQLGAEGEEDAPHSGAGSSGGVHEIFDDLTEEEQELLSVLGGSSVTPGHSYRSGVLRLSHAQWERATQDLLRLTERSGETETFTQDPTARFDTSTSERVVAGTLRLDYERGAEAVAEMVAGNRAHLMSILPPGTPETSEAIAAGLADHVARLAYRRTPSPQQRNALLALFQAGASDPDPIFEGSRRVLSAILQSPFFLYRLEIEGERDAEEVSLSSLALASKLSFALWNSIPSLELLDAGESGQLSSLAELRAWAERMIDDPRAADVLERIHTQLFRVQYLQNVAKNTELFPEFASDLAPTLREQSRLFFRDVAVDQRGGIGELLTSTTVYVNDQTAPLYGLSSPGAEHVRAELTAPDRSGYLTQVPYLAKNAGLSSTDPIHRGLFVVQELLCADLPPPPNDVPPLPPPEPDQSTRERYEGHTGPGTCGGGCHVVINAPGYALEGFDAIGRSRTIDAGKPVDTAATLPVGGAEFSFNGAVDLTEQLADSDVLHACYARRLSEYVLGREPTAEEMPFLLDVASTSSEQRSAHDVLVALVTSPLFTTRNNQEDPQ